MKLVRVGSAGLASHSVASPAGIDVDAVSMWLQSQVRNLKPPIRFDQIMGGRSNLTFGVTDVEGSRWILRRPPLGGLLATAHDMVREARILAALGQSPIPVPDVAAVCHDEAVTGAPFYVMEFVPGTVLRTRSIAEGALKPEQRRAAGLGLVDLLALLHSIDPSDVGLADLSPAGSYIERQLRRWRAQVGEAESRLLPLIDEIHGQLGRAIPSPRSTSIVHGDFRLDNCIVSYDGSIDAVLDWELCTLGDPLADLGMLLVYWSEPTDAETMLDDAPTTAAGFPTRPEVIERYSQAAGEPVDHLGFYVAFAYWKLACIVDGVASRLEAGMMGDSDVSASVYAEKAIWLAEESAEALRQHSRID